MGMGKELKHLMRATMRRFNRHTSAQDLHSKRRVAFPYAEVVRRLLIFAFI